MRRFFLQVLAAAMVLIWTSHAHAEDLLFALVNETSVELLEIHLSPSEVPQQKADVLGGKPLLPGEGIDIVIAEGAGTCLFNILGVFADGDTVAGDNVNLCDLGIYTFLER